jgi:hypothetical protein
MDDPNNIPGWLFAVALIVFGVMLLAPWNG